MVATMILLSGFLLTSVLPAFIFINTTGTEAIVVALDADDLTDSEIETVNLLLDFGLVPML